MSNTNGLISTPGVFSTGDVNSNFYLRKGDDITLEQLTLTDGAGNDAVLSIQNGDLTIQADNEIVMDPNGAGNATLTVQGSGGDLIMSSSNVLQLVANNRIDIAPIGLSLNGALSVTSNTTSVTLASKTAPT